jgi:hypothetical protein
VAPTELSFSELERLRRTLVGIRDSQVASLTRYYSVADKGFGHKLTELKLSKASTATCVASLLATHLWDQSPVGPPPWAGTSLDLARTLLTSTWKSAGLPIDNVFTTSFVLECVTDLGTTLPANTIESDAVCGPLILKATEILGQSLANGGASIQGYPPTAYVTQLVVRTLAKRGRLDAVTAKRVRDWARPEITAQITFVAAESKNVDVFQLAYAVMLVAKLTDAPAMTPDDARLIRLALGTLFEKQLPDGSWPRSRPLFHYPGIGSAYCYEYEMLVQLLQTFQERREPERLLPFLEHLRRATEELPRTAFRLDQHAHGWSSGHHPQLEGPESWSTASVFHFAHALDRLLAEAIRINIFEYLDIVYSPPTEPFADEALFAPDFLDGLVWKDEKTAVPLKKAVFDSFVKPLADHVGAVRYGGQIPDTVATSAIFFGPPGTSKTELSEKIARYLGWPRLTVDPSHIVRNGLDLVQTEANKLFGMLAVAEEIVVLLDEFDELVRERGASAEVLSRFLTTAMLPKLATIRKRRRIVFIIATNHIETFDIAISRPGRFDVILQIMPPTAEAKLNHWSATRDHLLTTLNLPSDFVNKHIEGLTYEEFRLIEPKLRNASADEALKILAAQHARSTLQMPHVVTDNAAQTWHDISVEQRTRVRLP